MTRMKWDSLNRKSNLFKPTVADLNLALGAVILVSTSPSTITRSRATGGLPTPTVASRSRVALPSIGASAKCQDRIIQSLIDAAENAEALHDCEAVTRYARAARQSLLVADIPRTDARWELIANFTSRAQR